MPEEEKCLETKTVYDGRLLKVRADRVQLPGGSESTREVVTHPGAVAMVPVTADDQVVLVQQWRYAAGGPLLEIPAGTLEPGEEPVTCAARELAEEIGCRAGRLEPLGSFFVARATLPSAFTSIWHGLQPAEGEPDADEAIEMLLVPLAQAVAMARDGRIEDAKSIIGLLLAAERLRDR